MNYMRSILLKNKRVLMYGSVLFLLLIGLKYLQLRFLIFQDSEEAYIGVIALLFTGLGIWISGQFRNKGQQAAFRSQENFTCNEEALRSLDFSDREWEILRLLSSGMSNQEIADRLFLSVSTVKTHVSAIFVKMDVKSRTKAMEMAKRLRIVP